MSIDWASLALVTVVTVLVTSFILAITSSAARMLDEAGEVKGLHAAELAAGFFLALALGIIVFGLWLMIPYYH